MRVLDWNIKCNSDINKVLDFICEKAEDNDCIITLQEVKEERMEIVEKRMGDRFHVISSLIYRKPSAFDTDNRRLGVVILVSKDYEVADAGVFDRCPLPDRTLWADIRKDGKTLRVVSAHALTGSGFKYGKAAQFRSLAECVDAASPDIFTMDANEPMQDHYDIEKMVFWEQGAGDKGDSNGAKLLFTTLEKKGLTDSFSFRLSDWEKRQADTVLAQKEPLEISYADGTNRRYDFVFAKNSRFAVIHVEYLYNESVEATSDHAMVAVWLEER